MKMLHNLQVVLFVDSLAFWWCQLSPTYVHKSIIVKNSVASLSLCSSISCFLHHWEQSWLPLWQLWALVSGLHPYTSRLASSYYSHKEVRMIIGTLVCPMQYQNRSLFVQEKAAFTQILRLLCAYPNRVKIVCAELTNSNVICSFLNGFHLAANDFPLPNYTHY